MYFPELPDIHLGAPGMPLWVTAEEEPAGAQLGRNLRLPDSCPPATATAAPPITTHLWNKTNAPASEST